MRLFWLALQALPLLAPMMCEFTCWRGHSRESALNVKHIEEARTRIGMTRAEMAELMGISEAQLSRQLAGMEHLSAHRLQALPQAFHLAYDDIRASRHEELHVIADTKIAAIVWRLDRIQSRLLRMEESFHHRMEDEAKTA